MTATNNFIWEYFERRRKNAFCKFCGRVYVGYNLGRLRRHVLFLCKSITPEARTAFSEHREQTPNIDDVLSALLERSNDPEEVRSQNPDPPDRSSPPNLPACTSRPSTSSTDVVQQLVKAQKKKQDEVLAKALLSSNVPLSFLANPFFKQFCQQLNPQYVVPSQSDILSPTVIQEMKRNAKRLIDNSEYVTISVNSDGLHNIVVHDSLPEMKTHTYRMPTKRRKSEDEPGSSRMLLDDIVELN